MANVYNWNDIKDIFNDTLILGNGASIAVDSCFKYSSLKDKADEYGYFNDDVNRVFNFLDTSDFELVLKMLWHANQINLSLGIEDNITTKTYSIVRDSLIHIIRSFHSTYESIYSNLYDISEFMSKFNTVISINYDLLVYWSMLLKNDDTPYKFKDCFINGSFIHDNWYELREPYQSSLKPTLVFYPHGNISLASDLSGNEFKISTKYENLLHSIFKHWRSGKYNPVFVSEGYSHQKKMAIKRSPYLSTVYHEVLSDLGEAITIFGWSFSDNDDHLLDAICSGSPFRFAVSVNPNANNLEEHEAKIKRKLKDRLNNGKFELYLFDRNSKGCWINS